MVECDEATMEGWRFQRGMYANTRAYMIDVSIADLDGAELLSNKIEVDYFPPPFLLVQQRSWYHEIFFVGDASHTRTFQWIGKTKLAIEDADALQESFDGRADVATALQRLRKHAFDNREISGSGIRDMVWFAHARQYLHLRR